MFKKFICLLVYKTKTQIKHTPILPSNRSMKSKFNPQVKKN